MGFTILMIIEGLCIIPFILIRDKEGKRRIDNDDLVKIEAGFIIVASILNWFVFGSSRTGFSILGVGGYYGAEELNIIGLAWSIIPPILIDFIGYLLYLLMTEIRYRIIFLKEKRKGREKSISDGDIYPDMSGTGDIQKNDSNWAKQKHETKRSQKIN